MAGLNSLAPGRLENNFQKVFFKLISWIDTLSNSWETVLRRMPQNPSDDKSTLVQVMAWCRQATSHYLSQCCPRSLSPHGITRPQWFNILKHEENGQQFAHWLINVYFIFLNKHHCILIEISLKFVSNGLYRQQVITWTNDECFWFKGNYFHETLESRHYLSTIEADGLVI